MTKYHSTRVEIDGIKFDSKAEAERYQELKLLEQAGDKWFKYPEAPRGEE